MKKFEPGAADLKNKGLVRILFRGSEIDVKARNGRIVNLIVRADKQDGRSWWRFLKYISNAFYRIGDLINPGYHKGGLRVIEFMMSHHYINNCLTKNTDIYVFSRIPIHRSNGDSSYETLVIYEGIKNHQLGLTREVVSGLNKKLSDLIAVNTSSLNKCTGDIHVFSDTEKFDSIFK